ncbi:ParB/RepB/Spo0J family partition protein [Chlamydiota bacterium]
MEISLKETYSLVPVKKINYSQKDYCFRSEIDDSILIDSVKKVGIIHPLILKQEKEQNPYTIISGFRRFVAAQKLKLNDVPAYLVLDNQFSKKDLFILFLEDNRMSSEFSIGEKACLLLKTKQLFHDDEAFLYNKILPLIGVPPNPTIISQYLALASSDSNLKDAVALGIIQLDSASTVSTLSELDREMIISLFKTLTPGINNQKELLTLLYEISRRNITSIPQLLKKDSVSTILSNNKLSNQQKLSSMLLLLKKIRFPHLSDLENRFNKIKKEMKLPPQVTLSSFPFFEKNEFRIHFSFSSFNDYTKIIDKLQDCAKKGMIDSLENITD